jgi:hypothetical protein
MKMSLPSRELIADSIEISPRPCPSMASSSSQLRQDRARHAHGHAAPQHPLHHDQRRAHAARQVRGKTIDLITVFEGVGKVKSGA